MQVHTSNTLNFPDCHYSKAALLRTAPLGAVLLRTAPLGAVLLRTAHLGAVLLRTAPLGGVLLRTAPLGAVLFSQFIMSLIGRPVELKQIVIQHGSHSSIFNPSLINIEIERAALVPYSVDLLY